MSIESVCTAESCKFASSREENSFLEQIFYLPHCAFHLRMAWHSKVIVWAPDFDWAFTPAILLSTRKIRSHSVDLFKNSVRVIILLFHDLLMKKLFVWEVFGPRKLLLWEKSFSLPHLHIFQQSLGCMFHSRWGQHRLDEWTVRSTISVTYRTKKYISFQVLKFI